MFEEIAIINGLVKSYRYLSNEDKKQAISLIREYISKLEEKLDLPYIAG